MEEFEIIEPKIDANHKYAVTACIPETQCREMVVIQTYPTIRDLKEGYKEWKSSNPIRTRFFPVEFKEPLGEAHVLEDLIDCSDICRGCDCFRNN